MLLCRALLIQQRCFNSALSYLLKHPKMESPSAALEHRVSNLESLIGETPTDDGVERPACLFSALRDAALSTVAAVGPDRPDCATSTLRRARFLREHTGFCMDISEVAVGEAGLQVKNLERALSELAVLSPVLDRNWEKENVDLKHVQETVSKANTVADAAEEAIEKESRAVDEFLIDYNLEVESMNARFLRLEGLVQALERKYMHDQEAGKIS